MQSKGNGTGKKWSEKQITIKIKVGALMAQVKILRGKSIFFFKCNSSCKTLISKLQESQEIPKEEPANQRKLQQKQ